MFLPRRSLALLLLGAAAVAPACNVIPPQPARDMYARCNLRVLKGNRISWISWQSTPLVIPAGEPLVVSGGPRSWRLERKTGKVYTLDAGSSGEEYLKKFVTEDEDCVSSDCARTRVAKIGMTKEQVYVAMGPPATADLSPTDAMTLDEIMLANVWTWRRRRFAKNLGVEFDPDTEKVSGTEGFDLTGLGRLRDILGSEDK